MDNMTLEKTVSPEGLDANWVIPSWCSFVLGGVFTFLLVYIGIARPAAHEMALMKRQMSTLEQSIWEVAGQSDTAKKTNKLLALLAEQKEVATEAEGTLHRMQQLNHELAAEADRTQQALTSVDELIALKDSVLEGSDGTREAAKVFATAHSLHNRLASSANTTAEAVGVSEQLLTIEENLLDSSASVDELVALKDSVLEGSAGTREAAKVFAAAHSLHDRLASSANTTAEAILVSEQLLAMEENLRDSTAEVQTAQETLNQMLDIHDSLDHHSADVTTAQLRVDSLLTLKDTIIAETANLADAIETLELSYDLTNHYQKAAVAFEQMRRWMVEVVATESILERAQNTLKPLAELGNLRHLTSDQLRTAAREISRGYQTQVAQKPQAIDDLGSAGALTAAIDSDDLTLTDSVDVE